MSAVTTIWSVVAACALVLGLMYGMVWVMDRQARASLAFAGVAFAIVGQVIIELGMAHASTPAEWGEWIRWSQVPVFVRVSATVIFIRLYFGTGRLWLLSSIIAIRLFILVVGFLVEPNFNFKRIDGIETVTFLGERLTVLSKGVPAEGQWLASFCSLLVLLFVADASLQLWRTQTREARRRALLIGGATLGAATFTSAYTQVMIWAGARIPVLLSPPYLLMLGAMTLELTRDTLRASRLSRELRTSEARLELAASAAGLGLWTWEARHQRLWATAPAQAMFGLEPRDQLEIGSLRATVDVDDLTRVGDAWRAAAASSAEAEVQFRVRLPDDSLRWLAVRGRSDGDERGQVVAVQGVVRDVTEQVQAREENEQLRRELAHAGRVSVLGTLSSSLAHELGQPLAAILLNAEAAELLLQRPDPDLEELRSIIADIRRDDTRAAEVIDRLRSLLRRRQLDFSPLSPDALVADVVALVRSDAIARHVALECSSEPGVPMIRGDRVHLSQVVLNLVLNAMDAVADRPPENRQVTLHTRAAADAGVEIVVADSGAGIDAAVMNRIFEPFFTTKPNGMGMGLSVSHTIVEAHGGKLWAENAPQGGAVFHVALPPSAGVSDPRG